jgi:hypothetical protein
VGIVSERLVGDPIPVRAGQYMGYGIPTLTVGEHAAVLEVLRDPGRRVLPSTGEDLWVAFVSLLWGNYLKETHRGSGKYALTTKGWRYWRQLEGVGREPAIHGRYAR